MYKNFSSKIMEAEIALDRFYGCFRFSCAGEIDVAANTLISLYQYSKIHYNAGANDCLCFEQISDEISRFDTDLYYQNPSYLECSYQEGYLLD